MKITSVLSVLCALFAVVVVSAQVPKISLNAPANNATDVQLNPNCIWQSVSSATSYWFEVSSSTAVDAVTGEFTTKTRNHKFTMKTDNFWQIRAGLRPNTRYYWHVMAKIGDETGPWSDMWSFTTTNVVDRPYQVFPDEDATMIDMPTTMIWMQVPNATKYYLQIVNLSNDRIVVNESNITDNDVNAQDVRYTVNNLPALTQYSWRVRSMVKNVWGKWTDYTNFTTGETLAAPTLLTPANGEGNQPVDAILTYRVDNGQTYRVDVSADKEFKNEVGTFTNSCGSIHLTNLEYLTTYYWRARPESDISTGEWSAVWSFTTVAPATAYLTDLMIKATGYGTSNIGESLQDRYSRGTYFAVLEANALKKAVFYITVKNAGNVTGDIDVVVIPFDNASQTKLSKWVVKFTNSAGKDLSKSVLNGNAYRIENMVPGTTQVYRLEVSPSSGVLNNDAISMLVSTNAVGTNGAYDPEARDCVKAVTVKTARGNK